MDHGNINPTQHLPWWLRETWKEPQSVWWAPGFELSKCESSVMNFYLRYALCIQKLYHRPHFIVDGNWNKSLHLQLQQRCYCENLGNSASAWVMQYQYSYHKHAVSTAMGQATACAPGFDPRSGQVSWVSFFRGFFSRVKQMTGSFRPPRSPNIIWPSSSSSIIIHYRHQWPETLIRSKTLNIQSHLYITRAATDGCHSRPCLACLPLHGATNYCC